MWITITIIIASAFTMIATTAIITDMISENKKTDVKRIEKEIELEKLRIETFEIETQKLRIDLEHSKQKLLEMKQ